VEEHPDPHVGFDYKSLHTVVMVSTIVVNIIHLYVDRTSEVQ